MKRLILSLQFVLVSVACTFAQLGGDGYYRIQNVSTGRYVVLIDNVGSIDLATSSADLGAIHTLRGYDKVVGNPASVIYVKKVSGSYNLIAQGTDAHEIVGIYLDIRDMGNNVYRAYKTKGGVTVYLCDEDYDTAEGYMMSSGSRTRDWRIIPITSSSDNYFGITPELSVEGVHYATLYASFPVKLSSSGLKAYYIRLINEDVAVYDEITEGEIPASTPVIIQCSSDSYANNRAEVLSSTSVKVTNNQLKGVYFDNVKRKNATPYDASTMRVLGKLSDGSLGFVKASFTNLPANKAYLEVPEGTPDELHLMSYEKYLEGIHAVAKEGKAGQAGVYSITGHKLSDNGSADGLPAGLYLINGKKVAVK